MTIFLCLCLGLSALLMLLGYVLDASALANKVSGANGLPLFVAIYASAAATLPVMAVTAWVLGFASALAVMVVSGVWHYCVAKLLLKALQRQANRLRGT